ncbi:hypothetical protein M405DRAFT_930890 [Rhizopogon salebrosus TDB-379]|nr:hypothetical protein M405DRAFT_930890 [Rhizopogon salebrosus TDB-379]
MVRSAARMHFGVVSNYPVIHTHRLIQREEGGSEALPPGWFQYQLGDGTARHQDNNLHISSIYRPLPGVRLGESRKCCYEGGTHRRA